MDTMERTCLVCNHRDAYPKDKPLTCTNCGNNGKTPVPCSFCDHPISPSAHACPSCGHPTRTGRRAGSLSGLTVSGLLLGLLAIFFSPILLGTAAMTLGIIASSRGAPGGVMAALAGAVGAIVGMVLAPIIWG
ncbi:MAG: hypothetical protein ACPHK8_02880 [Thermoplasmatota archaeon]